MTEIKYRTMSVGDLETNCYLVWEDKTKKCFIIDPGDDGIGVSEKIQVLGLLPIGVLATHGHFDHVMGALDLKLIYDVPFYCHSDDLFLLKRQKDTARYFLKKNVSVPNFEKIDVDLKDYDQLNMGEVGIEIIKTPGHTPGGVCFYLKEAGLLFSGDTIFAHSRGRTDLSYSSTKDIYRSIANLMELPPETMVLPGHGEETTIASEISIYKF